MGARKKRRSRLLSHTRPPSTAKTRSLSSRATRSLIRNHHTVHKRLQIAIANNDTASIADLQNRISISGGLPKYQQASIQGQSSERGGDSSKVLVEWLKDLPCSNSHHMDSTSMHDSLRMLEVGALKVDNACSRSGFLDVTRIDLHSQHPAIETQDFMERPTPSSKDLEEGGFDLVSLSLVVNYVGDAVVRGEMLKRVSRFLRRKFTKTQQYDAILPGLFLVLPAPCIENSRYLDEERLEAIMVSLGYQKERAKMSRKLVYYLWKYNGFNAVDEPTKCFKKQSVRTGTSRNNFAIVLK